MGPVTEGLRQAGQAGRVGGTIGRAATLSAEQWFCVEEKRRLRGYTGAAMERTPQAGGAGLAGVERETGGAASTIGTWVWTDGGGQIMFGGGHHRDAAVGKVGAQCPADKRTGSQTGRKIQSH